jgi:hypothetical protein
MPKFKVKFEICGIKKFKIIEADNEFRADMEVRKLLHIYKPEMIIDEAPTDAEVVNRLKDMFGMK